MDHIWEFSYLFIFQRIILKIELPGARLWDRISNMRNCRNSTARPRLDDCQLIKGADEKSATHRGADFGQSSGALL